MCHNEQLGYVENTYIFNTVLPVRYNFFKHAWIVIPSWRMRLLCITKEIIKTTYK